MRNLKFVVLLVFFFLLLGVCIGVVWRVGKKKKQYVEVQYFSIDTSTNMTSLATVQVPEGIEFEKAFIERNNEGYVISRFFDENENMQEGGELLECYGSCYCGEENSLYNTDGEDVTDDEMYGSKERSSVDGLETFAIVKNIWETMSTMRVKYQSLCYEKYLYTCAVENIVSEFDDCKATPRAEVAEQIEQHEYSSEETVSNLWVSPSGTSKKGPVKSYKRQFLCKGKCMPLRYLVLLVNSVRKKVRSGKSAGRGVGVLKFLESKVRMCSDPSMTVRVIDDGHYTSKSHAMTLASPELDNICWKWGIGDSEDLSFLTHAEKFIGVGVGVQMTKIGGAEPIFCKTLPESIECEPDFVDEEEMTTGEMIRETIERTKKPPEKLKNRN